VQTELESLRSEKLTADERALAEATAKAAEDACQGARTELTPRLQAG
jgi:hypothetical protein